MAAELLDRAGNDLTWFGKHYNDLIESYNNKFIAIKSKKVLEVDKEFPKLMIKLEKMGESPNEILVKYMSRIERIL